MVTVPLTGSQNDDPRKLRQLLDRVLDLAGDHQLGSVVIGMAGREGDLEFPEVVNFVESALRVEDSIFRMTRNRAVFFLADTDQVRAAEILGRVLGGYGQCFASVKPPGVSLSYFEVEPGNTDLTLKEVLPALFAPPPESH